MDNECIHEYKVISKKVYQKKLEDGTTEFKTITYYQCKKCQYEHKVHNTKWTFEEAFMRP